MTIGTMSDLVVIANDANKWGADIFISNHFNAGGGDGWEGLVYAKKNIPLGQIFEKHIKAVGQNSRGVKLRQDLAVLRLTNMPAVLNEGAFVDNLKDIQNWNDDAELKRMGIAYAEAVAEYLKLERKANELYCVQTGAYRNRSNADTMVKKLKTAGFDAYVVRK